MSIRVVPIDFQEKHGIILPADSQVGEAAQQFMLEELAERADLSKLAKSWLAVEVGKDGELVRPLGISGYRVMFDIPLFRSIDEGATVALANRMSAFFSDQGFRGKDVLLYVPAKEAPEQRCPNWQKYLEKFGARAADRMILRVW